MANFSPGWNFSLVSRAEISARLLKQILMKSNWRLHGEGFSPGRNSARAEKYEKIPCNRNGISARAEKQKKWNKGDKIENLSNFKA